MSILTPEGLPYEDRHGHEILPSFRNMIRLEALLDDEQIPEHHKTFEALSLLYGDSIPSDVFLAIQELMWFYAGGDEEPGGSKASPKATVRLYDFEQDADCIYAAFLQAYNIDISSDGEYLHWWAFRALFLCLPESTAMAQRMYYRGVDTSKLKGKQLAEMMERKKAVALKKKKPAVRSLEDIEKSAKERADKRFAQMRADMEKQ